MEALAFSIFNGLLYGMLLFMLASGLTLIFSMMGVLNFAHAAFFMLGAYFAYTISNVIGFWPALLLAPILVGLIGALIERYGLRPVYKFGPVAELLFTFGIAFVIEELVEMTYGKIPQDYGIPDSLEFTLFVWQGLEYQAYRVFMLVVSVGIFVALLLILKKTRVGMIVQASLSHPHTVGQLGHNVPRVFMWTFGFGCALAGLAGVIGGNVLGTEPAMAAELGPIIFVVIVIGGLGSLGGALIASLFIGVLDNLAKTYTVKMADVAGWLGFDVGDAEALSGTWKDIMTSSTTSLSDVIPYFLLVLILIFRPRGLFGTRDV